MKRRYLPTLSLVVVASLALTTAPRAQQRDDFQLVETTIAELQAQYAERNLTPEDVVEMYLARIHRFDQSAGQPLNNGNGPQPLNSFMNVNEDALEQAARLRDDDRNGSGGEGR